MTDELRRDDSDDDAWAQRVSSGVASKSRAALAELYERRYQRMYWIVRDRTNRDDDFACDCVHEAWLRVLRSLPAVPTVAALDAWLVRTALSAALDRIKSDAARVRRESAAPIAGPNDEHALVLQLREEIERLSADDREAITLRYLRERSIDALSLALGIRSKAAESRVRRALGRLRSRLTEVEHG